MVDTLKKVDVHTRPLAPKNPLPYRRQLKALRTYHTGLEALRDTGGPVTRLVLAPKWLMPPVVAATSPRGARDVLGRIHCMARAMRHGTIDAKAIQRLERCLRTVTRREQG
jgi:hypothetical protein